MNLPQIFAAGFPRCGTTWIAKCMSQHPEVHVPIKNHKVYPYMVKKEIHYFNKYPSDLRDKHSENQGFNRNITEYTQFFIKDKINIDFSICSAYDITSAVRVKEILGDIKILFFTRNRKDHVESIKTLIKSQEEISYLSDFEPLIEQYKNTFSNIKIVDLEETKKYPEAVLKSILEFIGVKDINFKFDLSVSKHSSEEIRKYRK